MNLPQSCFIPTCCLYSISNCTRLYFKVRAKTC